MSLTVKVGIQKIVCNS